MNPSFIAGFEAGREAAIKVCDEQAVYPKRPTSYEEGMADGAANCGNAIRTIPLPPLDAQQGEAQPVAWARWWHIQQIKPTSEVRGNKLLPVTKQQCLSDDVPLYAHPPVGEASPRSGDFTDEQIDRALDAFYSHPNNRATQWHDVDRGKMRRALAVLEEGK